MTANDERRILVDAAANLQAEIQKLNRVAFALVNGLLSEADMLKIAAANEITSGEVLKTTKLKFSAAAPPSAGSPEEPPPVLGKGQRACSICRRPGHRKQNCPEAHVKYDADRKGTKKKGKR